MNTINGIFLTIILLAFVVLFVCWLMDRMSQARHRRDQREIEASLKASSISHLRRQRPAYREPDIDSEGDSGTHERGRR